MTTHISSLAQWRQVTSSSSIVITDFYADWCGPCKVIAPTFESLATKYAKPNRIAFAKVNVDNNRDVAQLYSVSAMPTFIILHKGSVIDTIRGANPQALTAAVEKAVKLAGPVPGAHFATAGRTLGGTAPTTPTTRAAAGGTPIRGHASAWDLNKLIDTLIVFFGLYFVSLFSLDPYMAAQGSQFNKLNRSTAPIRTASGAAPFGGRKFATPTAGGGAGSGSAARPRTGPKAPFATLADLGSD